MYPCPRVANDLGNYSGFYFSILFVVVFVRLKLLRCRKSAASIGKLFNYLYNFVISK